MSVLVPMYILKVVDPLSGPVEAFCVSCLSDVTPARRTYKGKAVQFVYETVEGQTVHPYFVGQNLRSRARKPI